MDQQELNAAIYTEAINQKNRQVEAQREFLKNNHDMLSGSSLVFLSQLIEQLEMEMSELVEQSGVGSVAIEYEAPNHDNN